MYLLTRYDPTVLQKLVSRELIVPHATCGNPWPSPTKTTKKLINMFLFFEGKNKSAYATI